MKVTCIGIVGGSGAGKSTLCMALLDAYPDHIGLVQLDDYFKPSEEMPVVDGIVSSDHPESLYLDQIAEDLKELKKGNSVFINTKNERLNPDYKETGKRMRVQFVPKPIILVEGFLVLQDQAIRDQLSTSIWLDVPHDIRWSRRVHFKYDEDEKKILIPMHEKYVEPSKIYAEHCIDVSNQTKEQVFEQVKEILTPYLST